MQHVSATQTHTQDQIALHDGLESGVDATGLLAHEDQITLHDGLESGVVVDATGHCDGRRTNNGDMVAGGVARKP